MKLYELISKISVQRDSKHYKCGYINLAYERYPKDNAELVVNIIMTRNGEKPVPYKI